MLLKTLLEEKNISFDKFIKKFKEATGEQLSKASFSLFLNTGKELKKIPEFKEKIARTYNLLTKENKSKDELFGSQEDNMIESMNLSYNELKHFGLTRDPFLPFITKESEIVMLESHFFALEMMRAARETGQFTVITSEVGGGKTTVLGKFEAETKAMSDCLIVKVRTRDMDRCTAKDILSACVYDLAGEHEKQKRGFEALSRQVESLLKKHHAAGKRIVLIIDEAQDLHTHTLKYLKRLWELRDGLTPLMGIILIGQNELATRLYNDNNLAVREVTARTIHAPLEPINESLKDYIAGKVKCVKGDYSKIITDDAINALSNKLSIKDANGKIKNKAYPLEINNKLKMLMKLAYEQGIKVIDEEFVSETL